MSSRSFVSSCLLFVVTTLENPGSATLKHSVQSEWSFGCTESAAKSHKQKKGTWGDPCLQLFFTFFGLLLTQKLGGLSGPVRLVSLFRSSQIVAKSYKRNTDFCDDCCSTTYIHTWKLGSQLTTGKNRTLYYYILLLPGQTNCWCSFLVIKR